MSDHTGWKRMMFKGNKVWLRVDSDQQSATKDKKVLIKYQLDQDYKYWVPEKAVRPIDPSRLKKKAPKKKPGTRARTHKPVQPANETFDAKTIVAYTDGASSGNPGPSGIGVVLHYGDKQKEISRHIGSSTNNIAELMAIKTALEAIRTTDIPVRLHTDSQYCYGLLVLGWKARRNEVLIKAIKKLMTRFNDLKILKIKGHAGLALNEQADQLARDGANRDGLV